MIRHVVSEGWLLLRQRLAISAVLALVLAIPISLAGVGFSSYVWLHPMAARSVEMTTVAVLLHPRLDRQQRMQWMADQGVAHPEWTLREVAERDLAHRLSRWFPYLDDLLAERAADLPPLVEVVTAAPETVAELEGQAEVLAIGPVTSAEHVLGRVARRLAIVVAVLSGLLIAGAVLLSGVWVHLELYRHASEITIMRLVGATEATLRGPFLFAVGVPSLVAAALSLATTSLTVGSLSRAAAALGLPAVEAPPAVLVAQAVLAMILPLSVAMFVLGRHTGDAIED